VSVRFPEPPDWSRIHPLEARAEAVAQPEGSLRVPTSAGPLSAMLIEGGARLLLGDSPPPDYGILVSAPAPLPAEVTTGTDRTVLSHGDLRLEIGHSPLTLRLQQGDRTVLQSAQDGHFVRRYRLPPVARLETGWLISLDLGHETQVYGLGEKWGRLDHRGTILRSYNEDALGVNAERSYKNAPFAWSPDGWGVFVHTPAPVTHAVGYAPFSQRAYGLLVEDDQLDLFLMADADGPALLGRYTALTGHAPVPPLWSLGAILSRAYYRTADELLDTARAVRAHGMPCDTITLDGRAWQDTDTRFAFEWDPARYPDPGAVLDELKAMDFKVCVWEYPLVSVNSPLFAEMAARGWLLKDATSGETLRYSFDPEPFGEVLTQLPDSGLVDFTHPEAYADWRDRHRALYEIGVDMIKPDFGEQVPDHALAHDGSTGRRLHNVYALLYNRCVYEAAQRYAANGPFLFSRAAWTGSQRYPAQWGGDPQADFGGLAASIRGALSWGMSGGPYFATDVGGFYGDTRDPVLYVRWLQAAVFSAHLRLHGIGQREPWSYGGDAHGPAMEALRLRYRLIPYLRQVMETAARTGLPVMRAMPLACPDDPAAWAFDTQFFFGPDLLVAPCLNHEGRVRVYLPHGDWRRFPSAEPLAGGRVLELTLALDDMAVFARAGADIPLGPDLQHTGGLDDPPPVARIWPTEA